VKDAIAKCESASVPFVTLIKPAHPPEAMAQMERVEHIVMAARETAEAIAQVAREEDVELIVMGTRGLSARDGLLLGSVATQVVHLAEVPITLIK
jgi:nucleotide-binding universal stress UspA family protein